LDRVPAEVLVITLGVDTQDDRLECVVCGWTRTGECLVLAHEVIWGSYEDDATWGELDELLKSRWPHPLGGRLRVDACAIDCGDGQHFEKVLAFCQPRASKRVMAVKGQAGTRPSVVASKSKVKGTRLWIVGVDGIKATIFDRLQRGRMIRLGDSLTEVFYEQLASERRVVRYRRGQPVRTFQRIPGKRAESLDALVYAHAARAAVSVSLDTRAEELRQATPAAKAPAVFRSEWMSR
jgi:phage terminase large subunit GpA-like protein